LITRRRRSGRPLEVRRDCDLEYLRRADAFIRRSVEANTPF
jgi:hypothetical protein